MAVHQTKISASGEAIAATAEHNKTVDKSAVPRTHLRFHALQA